MNEETLAPNEMKVNLKVRVQSLDAANTAWPDGFVMTIQKIEKDMLTAARPRKGRGEVSLFSFYRDANGFRDGYGKPLRVTKFRRTT